MACSQFSVTKSNATFILPSEPTPNHTLPLSWSDKLPMFSVYVGMFYVYNHGTEQPGEVIKQALTKALVPYYPLAGRFVLSEKGEVTGVACTGDGVWFVDASAECNLEDAMGLLELPPSDFLKDQLLPFPPNPIGMPMMLQVTQFACGGFVVGLKCRHTMADGIGISQIMRAISDIARGLEQPMVAPLWLREQFPNPGYVNKAPPPPRPVMHLEYLIVDVPQDYINQTKALFLEKTGEWCTALDVTVARLWQCRIQAINPDPIVNNTLLLAADSRSLLSDLLPKEGGYYGNSVFPLMVEAPSDKIVEASIVEVVILIRNAKKKFPGDFSKLIGGEFNHVDKVARTADYGMMMVTDWTRLGFSEVDFGWGGPNYYAPASSPLGPESPPICVVIRPPKPKEGLRLVTMCIKKEHFDAFSHQMINFSKDVMS